MTEENVLPPREIDTSPHNIVRGDASGLPFDDSEFHAIVTDPPYNFDGGFMSKDWDNLGGSKQYQQWCEEWAKESLRVLKPGGHMLAFSSSQQFHRLFCGVEDAGFEIRDTLMWVYGDGFPKSHNVEKAIGKKLGEEDEREVVYEREESSGYSSIDKKNEEQGHRPNRYYDDEPDTIQYTAPASELAQKFEGFGTALKPAFEPIVLARKPLEEDTIAEQVMATGTGALNVDGCRISLEDGEEISIGYNSTDGMQEGWHREWMKNKEEWEDYKQEKVDKSNEEGRFPANLVLDQMASNMLDGGNGLFSAQSKTTHEAYGEESMFLDGESHSDNQYSDSGGPSRFFYTPKATKSERTMDGRIENIHPTVKPIDLIEWMVNLVTAEGQRVLDQFLGSGTTLIACERNNRTGTGVDMNQDYCKLATKRLGCEKDTELGSIFDY